MLNKKKRGFLASAGALVTAAALALGGSVAAHAETVLDMPQESGIIITKLEQVFPAGQAATGHEITGDLPSDTIPGVTFVAYQVPVTEAPGTNEWQQEIAAIDLEDAQAAVDFDEDPFREGETDANGQVIWKTGATGSQGTSLPWGLYLIRETVTPAGVVPSGDFLVAVPLTDPLTLNEEDEYESGLTGWLTDIFVYPKNATVTGEKTVENATDFVLGDTVTWSIDADIPAVRDHTTGAFVPTDRFEIWDTLTDAQLTLFADEDAEPEAVTAEDSVNVTAPSGLVKGTDYNVSLVVGTGTDIDEGENGIAVGDTQVRVIFTETGRAKLAAGLPSSGVGNVTVTLDTVVNSIGEIENDALVYPGGSSSYQIDPAEVKYGSINLIKSSVGSTGAVDLSGAEFMVFLTEDDAIAAVGGDAAALAKALRPEVGDHVDGVWTTDAAGEVLLTGLRYSDFANNETLVEGTDAEFQRYWLVETKALAGHQLLAEPYSFLINADSTAGEFDLDVENQFNTNGFVLPLTGGMGTALLTILGVGILAAVLVAARRRQNADAAAE